MAESEPTEPVAPVTFINRFTVHASAEEFEQTFAATTTFMAEQDGYLGNRLLRHTKDGHSYVNIAVWRDAEHFQKALQQPGFTPHATALRALSTSESNLYHNVAVSRR